MGIGVQKGGTSTLYAYLSLFKFAAQAVRKELHFFDMMDFEKTGPAARETYLAKFSKEGDVKVEVSYQHSFSAGPTS